MDKINYFALVAQIEEGGCHEVILTREDMDKIKDLLSSLYPKGIPLKQESLHLVLHDDFEEEKNKVLSCIKKAKEEHKLNIFIKIQNKVLEEIIPYLQSLGYKAQVNYVAFLEEDVSMISVSWGDNHESK